MSDAIPVRLAGLAGAALLYALGASALCAALVLGPPARLALWLLDR